MPDNLQSLTAEKRAILHSLLRENAPVLIAYSGGVDSTYLLAEAHHVLAGRARGVIADSASLPRKTLASALAVAEVIGVRVEVIHTRELSQPEYAANPVNRCYFCKAELFSKLEAIAQSHGFRAIAYGENADDMRQVRPGRQAAKEFSVIAPLRDAGLTKLEIRELSGELRLPTADAPAQPCLSSRISHGTPVTREALAMVERGEEFVRSLGFRVFRVRYLLRADRSAAARLEIAPDEQGCVAGLEHELVRGLLAVGYGAVEIAASGYRSAA